MDPGHLNVKSLVGHGEPDCIGSLALSVSAFDLSLANRHHCGPRSKEPMFQSLLING